MLLAMELDPHIFFRSTGFCAPRLLNDGAERGRARPVRLAPFRFILTSGVDNESSMVFIRPGAFGDEDVFARPVPGEITSRSTNERV